MSENYGTIEIDVHTENVTTALQKKLNALVNDNQTKQGVNQLLAGMIEKYVPKDTGNLRESIDIQPDFIAWRTPYAHYQYEGIVYGPNFRTLNKETGELEWRSPKRGKGNKYPTTRQLGWYSGYTTEGTSSHWVEEMWRNERRVANIRVTNYLKRRAREQDL